MEDTITVPHIHAPAAATALLGMPTDVGVLLFSLKKELLYLNARAQGFVAQIQRKRRGKSATGVLPASVLELCDALAHGFISFPDGCNWQALQVQRILTSVTGPIHARGVGLPDMQQPRQSRLLVLLELLPVSAPLTGPIDSPVSLTTREVSVLRGVAAGLTNKEIAVHLGVREGTVKEYLKRMRHKTGTAARAGLVRHLMYPALPG